jgi:hypothetical protein
VIKRKHLRGNNSRAELPLHTWRLGGPVRILPFRKAPIHFRNIHVCLDQGTTLTNPKIKPPSPSTLEFERKFDVNVLLRTIPGPHVLNIWTQSNDDCVSGKIGLASSKRHARQDGSQIWSASAISTSGLGYVRSCISNA